MGGRVYLNADLLTAVMDLHGVTMVAGIVIAAVIGRPVANPQL